jgi:hypothetical protein
MQRAVYVGGREGCNMRSLTLHPEQQRTLVERRRSQDFVVYLFGGIYSEHLTSRWIVFLCIKCARRLNRAGKNLHSQLL